jgi:hypothetical protein
VSLAAVEDLISVETPALVTRPLAPSFFYSSATGTHLLIGASNVRPSLDSQHMEPNVGSTFCFVVVFVVLVLGIVL